MAAKKHSPTNKALAWIILSLFVATMATVFAIQANKKYHGATAPMDIPPPAHNTRCLSLLRPQPASLVIHPAYIHADWAVPRIYWDIDAGYSATILYVHSSFGIVQVKIVKSVGRAGSYDLSTSDKVVRSSVNWAELCYKADAT